MASSISSSTAPTSTTATSTAANSTANSSASSTPAQVGVTLQSLGIGSGVDIASLVSELTTTQGAAQNNQLNARQTSLQTQVSAFGALSSALAAFQATLTPLETASRFEGRTVSVGDATVATATADTTATPAQYSLQVLNLATAANLVSQPVASAGSTVGTGTLNIAVGGLSAQVVIDGTDNTLAGIASAINAAPNNPGVNASVITTSDGARLELTGTNTGAINSITVTQSGGDGGLASLAYDPANNNTKLTQSQAAQDAQITVNGFTAKSASNQVTGVISGVTLNLLKASATNTSTSLGVGFDQTSAQSAIGNFVSAYNALVSTIQGLSSYDATTKVAGPLLGNASVNTLVGKLRGLVSQSLANNPGTVQALSNIGITANAQGTLDQNATTLTASLNTNIASIASLLGGTNGIASQLDSALTQYTQPGGLIDTINQGLKSGLTDVSKQQTALQARLAVFAAAQTAKFNAMDAAIASLKQTQNYIYQAFASIDGAGSSSTSAVTGSSSG